MDTIHGAIDFYAINTVKTYTVDHADPKDENELAVLLLSVIVNTF